MWKMFVQLHPPDSSRTCTSCSLNPMQEEAERMVYIFPDPKPAMELLVQRMFEERVKPVVDR